MALKFLNKKGWHTGSLRNIENVWKAEQKHEAEEKKLDEIRKQIQEERERAEFRQLQVQAGLIPQQERLEFLYDSGLAVGKNSDGFKALESLPKAEPPTAPVPSSSSQPQPPLAPGALFEDKPQSANDTWRKLHSDPLLLIRQREQEALAHIKNNPVRMAMIRKSVDEKKQKKSSEDKKRKERRRHKKSKHERHSSDDFDSNDEKVAKTGLDKHDGRGKRYDHKISLDEKKSKRDSTVSDEELNEITVGRKCSDKDHKHNYSRDRMERGHDNSRHERSFHEDRKNSESSQKEWNHDYSGHGRRYLVDRRTSESSRKELNHDNSRHERRHLEDRKNSDFSKEGNHDKSRTERRYPEDQKNSESSQKEWKHDKSRNDRSYPEDQKSSEARHRRRNMPVKLSEEERAEKLREMQEDAEIHEEQRWKRIKKAADDDAKEANNVTGGKNFLHASQENVYGVSKGGSTTIEESVRRRAYYSQDRSEADGGSAFRR